MAQRILYNTDKNGTRYYHCSERCGKCGGTGIINCYIPINGGECFDCGGSGIYEWNDKEYTPEYEAKLIEKREKAAARKLAKEMEKAAELNAEFFEKQGFNSEGKTYFILGDCYSIKDELKAQGAKWDNLSYHWHMAKAPEGMKTIEIDVNEMYSPNAAGVYLWNYWVSFEEGKEHYSDKVRRAEDELKASTSTSEWLGQEKEKISAVVTLKNWHHFETMYGVSTIYTFEDEKGNVLVWKTGSCIEQQKGDKLTLSGTIKELSEYKGIKQTVLTRCKIS